MDASREKPLPKRTRKKLFQFPPEYWVCESRNIGQSFTSHTETTSEQEEDHINVPVVSQKTTCSTCSLTFSNLRDQRDHFKTDWHKYNLQRKVNGRSVVTETEFEELSDLGSIDSLSGSESESDDEKSTNNDGKSVGVHAQKLEFPDPKDSSLHIVLWKASLPDENTLSSLQNRGSWAILMTGNGHFSAGVWEKDGTLQMHKTFHRYTSRRKQGGSQSAADSARGAGNRIRSAGATLRRYGEQSLQKEVRDLLKSWEPHLDNSQCIYIRAGRREKQELLVGWPESPLAKAESEKRLRNIPFPTRRPTLKEATRVYEELSTITVSPFSVFVSESHHASSKEKKLSVEARKQPTVEKEDTNKSAIKGTDHLKKREPESSKAVKQTDDESSSSVKSEEKDPNLEILFQVCLNGDEESLLKAIEEGGISDVVFSPVYFPTDSKHFKNVQTGLGLVGVAAVSEQTKLMEWLMDKGISPIIGASPYVSSKSKQVRNTLRQYWGKNPDKYDYAKAEIPGPLTEADMQAQQEKEREKRRKEREKKKEKARQKAEDAKPKAQKDRELRAAAAEARLLGNRCASCKKSLDGLTPFSRLAYKYCSTACVTSHREQLERLNSSKRK